MPRGRLDKAIPFLQQQAILFCLNQWLFEKKQGYRHTCSSRTQNVCRSHSAIQVYTKGFLAAPGDVVRFTDRRGKVSVYGYDNLDRLTFIGFGEIGAGVYESTINYTYDAGNRIRTVVDSLAGTITLDYDNFDRMRSQTSPQGTVSYTYDKVGRRKTMTVPGQAVVNYSYDDADRLTTITQGSATVRLTYDNADRLSSKTLPNGVIAEYDYDAASQLTAITYRLGDSILGNLTYEYDQTERRTKIGGSYARLNLPQVLTSANYNAANQLTQREATTLTYDPNGNLTNDGVNTYTWNARNQMVSISGSVAATFQYDGLGRRVNKTVNGQSTVFLYDGADVVQEQVGGTPSAIESIDGNPIEINALEYLRTP